MGPSPRIPVSPSPRLPVSAPPVSPSPRFLVSPALPCTRWLLDLQVKRLFPLCKTDDVLAGFYVEDDGRVSGGSVDMMVCVCVCVCVDE